jgi:transcriptional antiterminator RfaH
MSGFAPWGVSVHEEKYNFPGQSLSLTPDTPMQSATHLATPGDTEDTPLWYVVRTKGKQENIAKFNYERQGYRVYLPQLRVTVRHARRITERLTAFFPGYLFLHLAPVERNWATIASTRGASDVLCFGNTYVPIPDWVISDLKAREDKNRAIPMGALLKDKLTPGCIVAVNMAGEESLQGVVYSTEGTENVNVLLSILGRQVKAQVALARIVSGRG